MSVVSWSIYPCSIEAYSGRAGRLRFMAWRTDEGWRWRAYTLDGEVASGTAKSDQDARAQCAGVAIGAAA